MATRRCKASREAYSHFFDPKGVGLPSRSRPSMSACKSMICISFLRTSSPVRSASRRTSSGTLMRGLLVHGLIVPVTPDAQGTNHGSSSMAFMHSSTERASSIPTHSLPV